MPEVTLDLGYIPMSSPDAAIVELGDKANEILIPAGPEYIIVQLTYCLGRPTSFRYRPDNPSLGYTRGELAKGISTMYQTVYRVEEETMPEKQTHEDSGGRAFVFANRSRTTGKYAIWMHDLEDLILHTGYYNTETHKMSLGIDS